ncbi:hypothetical protein EUTSA_v10005333mg [Eutrema salsugineum]|uniref:DUF4371 domain-containing protein n=1 Tax=Eutrema salsugineum TaxID=72664 RepID=V4L0J0_EUTSA|nr:hypothetical protein EUTSA_v10005333mg [Eutrema salsugineum]
MIGNKSRRFNPSWFDLYGDWLEYSNKTERLHDHVVAVNSFHNSELKRADYLMNQGQSIFHAFYKIRLNVLIDACRYLLLQGLLFQGHDEPVDSTNKIIFMELVKYTAEKNELGSKAVLDNAPKNNQMEVIESIVQEVDCGVFCLLVDESADVSDKDQIAVVFRIPLQRKYQDILNSIIVKSNKQRLYKLRDNGWKSLINKVSSFLMKKFQNMKPRRINL